MISSALFCAFFFSLFLTARLSYIVPRSRKGFDPSRNLTAWCCYDLPTSLTCANRYIRLNVQRRFNSGSVNYGIKVDFHLRVFGCAR